MQGGLCHVKQLADHVTESIIKVSASIQCMRIQSCMHVLYMYECMYACTVCIHVYICMYVLYVCMCVCMYVCMCVCMYVCVCVCACMYE